MRKPNYRVIAIVPMTVAVMVIGLVTAASPMSVAAQAPGNNLLVNGDFEAWDWSLGHWPMMMGIPEVQICPGWQAFWIQDPPTDARMQEYWKRPEFRDVKAVEADYRVRSGEMAQKYFSFGGQHIAGIFQQVNGITPGTTLRFEVYMQTWGCMAGNSGWNICPTGHLSNSPSPFHTRVGIDPTGGTNPWAGTVVWSPEHEAYDQWSLFQVDAVAQGGTVTVFTYSHAEWWDNVFRMHNDVYIDDASLVALDAALVPVATEAPSVIEEPSEVEATADTAEEPTNTPAPATTPTPRPDGAVVHVVQSGDTVNAIAAAYDVEADQIKQLNDLNVDSFIYIGQELVISVEPVTAQAPTPTPDATLEVIPAATPQILPTATPQILPTATPQALPTATPQPTAVIHVLPTTVPTTPVPASTKTGGGSGFPFIHVIVSVIFGTVLGAVLNGRVKKH